MKLVDIVAIRVDVFYTGNRTTSEGIFLDLGWGDFGRGLPGRFVRPVIS